MDIPRLIGAVTREVQTRPHDGRPARVVIASRDYETSPEDLWDALTNPERIPRWFLPVSGDLREGGSYSLKGNASGEIERCAPPKHLRITWGMQGQVSWVDVQLSALEGGRTHLRLEHISHPPEAFWSTYGPGAVGIGWEQALMGLEQHFLETPEVTPEQGVAWQLSEEGRDHSRRCAKAWAEAWRASGEDPALVASATAEVTAFYTGEPKE